MTRGGRSAATLSFLGCVLFLELSNETEIRKLPKNSPSLVMSVRRRGSRGRTSTLEIDRALYLCKNVEGGSGELLPFRVSARQ